VGPFFAISRHDVVALASPWDPARVLQEYVDQTSSETVSSVPADSVAALKDGARIRYEMEHRWMGSIEAEMHLTPLSQVELQVEIDGAVWLNWWLRPFAIPFRSRLRRFVDRQIDTMLAELSEDAESLPAEAESAEPIVNGSPSARPSRGMRSSLRVFAPGGQLVHEHYEGTPAD
jgi:hypothetical protein